MAESRSTAVVEKVVRSPAPASQRMSQEPELTSAPAPEMTLFQRMGGTPPHLPPGQVQAHLAEAPDQPALLRQVAHTYGNRYLGQVLQRQPKDGATIPAHTGTPPLAPGGPGQPLDAQTRRALEPQFGPSVHEARVHSDGPAAQLTAQFHARALTVGHDIYLAPGNFQPHTPAGRGLLAHELTHVVQQRQAPANTPLAQPLLDTPENGYEQEARTATAQVHEGRAGRVQATPLRARGAVQRLSLEDVWEGAQSVASGVVGGARSVVSGVAQGVRSAVSTVAEGAQSAASAVLGDEAERDALRGRAATLRTRAAALIPRVRQAGAVYFTDALWMRLRGAVQSLLAQLPAPIAHLAGALSNFLSGQGVTMVASAIALPAILVALLDAIVLALWYLGLILLALILLYALYLLVEAIVEAIAEAIERMRNQPPIFWSLSLPLPGPIGMPMVRTKPPNPRVPGGQQDTVRAAIPPALRSVLIAHHVLPLFLGGRDELTAPPNVVPWPRPLHIVGHASLQIQPQMAIWGYPINIYSHPPPAAYFLAGTKSP